jgi:hypothetical protein
MKNTIPRWCLFLLFVVVVAPSTYAGGKSSFKAAPIPSHQEIVISRVTPGEIIIEERIVSAKGKIEEKRSKSFRITQFTEINVNGRRATINDLRPGMRVQVAAGTDRTQASRIDANG